MRLEPAAVASNDAKPKPPPEKMPTEITNSIGMKLNLIPPGKFLMGSPKDEQGREDNEGPQHEVEITRPIYMGIYPVTRGQFAEFAKDAGYKTEAETDGKGGGAGFNEANHHFEKKPAYSWRNPGFAQTDQYPVVNVTWNDAVKFCEWLSRKEGKTYELPTEAEWEYACRAGTTTRFWCGDADASLKGNANVYDASAKAAWGPSVSVPWDDGYPFTSPVGTFAANPWGLYDMGGNVWQWCADVYAPYREGPIKDPIGKDSGNRRILRGGSYNDGPRICRAAFRSPNDPGLINLDNGFRVVLRPSAPGVVPPSPPRPSPLDCTGEKGISAPDLRKAQEAWAAYLGRKVEEDDEIAPAVKMRFVIIPPGKFLMGSPIGEDGRWDHEGPQHTVEITRPFHLGVYPVTRGQFAAFVKDDGYKTEAEKAGDKAAWRNPAFPSYNQTDDDPVVYVSWNDAVKFCAWLSKTEEKTYELPTEAEWEYACRAGTTTAFSFGDDPKARGDYAWFADNSGNHTHPVGDKKANPWGLYDTHGNVWQWCADWKRTYQEGYFIDPKGSDDGKSRALRGGSWRGETRHCRSANINVGDPGLRLDNLGFRVVLHPTAPSTVRTRRRGREHTPFSGRCSAGAASGDFGVRPRPGSHGRE